VERGAAAGLAARWSQFLGKLLLAALPGVPLSARRRRQPLERSSLRPGRVL